MNQPRASELVRLNVAPDGWLQGQWSHAGGDIAVLFVHGFVSVRYGEKSAALEESCARRGWTFATFDLRGHGESSGTLRDLTGARLLGDLDAVANFLTQKGIRRLALVGSSMGGWASAWFSLRRPELVKCCAFIAPGFHFLTARWEKLAHGDRETWRREGILRIKTPWGPEAELGYALVEDAPNFPHERLLKEYCAPGLIFHGLKDDVVPFSRSIAFIEQAACSNLELRLYKDGDHRLVDRKDEMAESACLFFERWL